MLKPNMWAAVGQGLGNLSSGLMNIQAQQQQRANEDRRWNALQEETKRRLAMEKSKRQLEELKWRQEERARQEEAAAQKNFNDALSQRMAPVKKTRETPGQWTDDTWQQNLAEPPSKTEEYEQAASPLTIDDIIALSSKSGVKTSPKDIMSMYGTQSNIDRRNAMSDIGQQNASTNQNYKEGMLNVSKDKSNWQKGVAIEGNKIKRLNADSLAWYRKALIELGHKNADLKGVDELTWQDKERLEEINAKIETLQGMPGFDISIDTQARNLLNEASSIYKKRSAKKDGAIDIPKKYSATHTEIGKNSAGAWRGKNKQTGKFELLQ